MPKQREKNLNQGPQHPHEPCRYWPVLQWRNLDADLLNCSHVAIALSNQVQCMENASSHYDAKVALSKIMAHLLADKGAKPGVCQRLSVEVFYTLKWEVAFERYTLYWYIFVNPQIRGPSRGEVNGVTWNKTFVASKVKEKCFNVKGTQVNVFISHVCSLLFTRTFSL